MTTGTFRQRLFGWIGVLLASTGLGCGRAPAPETGPAPPLVLDARDVFQVAPGTVFLGVPITGHLSPITQIQVKSSISGRIKAVRISRGISVERGELLVEFDDGTFKAQQAGAEASMAAAQRDYAAAEMLFKAGSAAERDLINARASLQSAQAQVAGAQESLTATRVTSPISGVITEKFVDAGGTVVTGERLFTVADLSTLELAGMVDASEVGKIRVGQGVSLTIDSEPDHGFEGTVSRIERIASAGTQQITVFVRISNSEHRLLAGLFTRGTIRTDVGPPRPIVPLTAVQGEGEKSAVFLIEGERLKRVPIVLGQQNLGTGMAEVTSGLEAGARILISPTDQAKDGERVAVSPAATPAARPTSGTP